MIVVASNDIIGKMWRRLKIRKKIQFSGLNLKKKKSFFNIIEKTICKLMFNSLTLHRTTK